MKGVTFDAWREHHYVGLAEILRVLGRDGQGLVWRLKLDEVAPDPTSYALEEILPTQVIDTRSLLALVDRNTQIVDGVMTGFDASNESSPIVIIRAVDSTSWDVESNDEELIARIRRAFPDSRDIPEGGPREP